MDAKEECIICFYDKSIEDYICFSCGHRVCSTCYPLMRNICPVCRFKENDLLQIEIVIPTQIPDNIPRYNFQRMFITVMCSAICFIVIYLIIIIPFQKSFRTS
jgi:hypothetical protein